MSATAITCQQNPEALADFLPICNRGCVHKHQDMTSMYISFLNISFRQRVLATAGSVDLFLPHPNTIVGDR